MKAIFKYRIQIVSEYVITMPKDAKIISVQTQLGLPQMWAIVDTNNPTVEKREFRIIATGENFDYFNQDWQFIGTFQIDNGKYIYHLFEVV